MTASTGSPNIRTAWCSVATYEGSGTADRRFLSADERGSIVSVTDSVGTLLGINRYDEYGQPQSTNIGVWGYTGQAWLPSIGVWYYKARVYEPELGRFLQTDPIGYVQGPNLYVYVVVDPVNLVDPLGLQAGDPPCPDEGCPSPGPNLEVVGNLPVSVPSALPAADSGPAIFVTAQRIRKPPTLTDRCAARVTNDPGVGIGPFTYDPQIALGVSALSFSKHQQGTGRSYFGGDVTTSIAVFNDVKLVTAGSFAVRASSGGLMGYRARVTGAVGHIVGFDRGSGYRPTQYLTVIWRITVPATLSRSGKGYAVMVTAFPGC